MLDDLLLVTRRLRLHVPLLWYWEHQEHDYISHGACEPTFEKENSVCLLEQSGGVGGCTVVRLLPRQIDYSTPEPGLSMLNLHSSQSHCLDIKASSSLLS